MHFDSKLTYPFSPPQSQFFLVLFELKFMLDFVKLYFLSIYDLCEFQCVVSLEKKKSKCNISLRILNCKVSLKELFNNETPIQFRSLRKVDEDRIAPNHYKILSLFLTLFILYTIVFHYIYNIITYNYHLHSYNLIIPIHPPRDYVKLI